MMPLICGLAYKWLFDPADTLLFRLLIVVPTLTLLIIWLWRCCLCLLRQFGIRRQDSDDARS
jgi:hypothetical protein